MRQINQSYPSAMAPCFTSPKNAVVLLFLDLFHVL